MESQDKALADHKLRGLGGKIVHSINCLVEFPGHQCQVIHFHGRRQLSTLSQSTGKIKIPQIKLKEVQYS